MPLEKERVSWGFQPNCPNCGSDIVSSDNPHQPNHSDFIIYGDGEENQYQYDMICWDCGWHEEVKVEVARNTIDEGK